MTPEIATALIGGGASLIGSLINTGSQMYTQNKTWEREDNAVQRRTADLEAAGFSPTLAAGSAADSKKTDAPGTTLGQAVSDAVNLGLDAALKMQEIDVKKAQAENTRANTAGIIFGNGLNDSTRDALVNQRYASALLGLTQYQNLAAEGLSKYDINPYHIRIGDDATGRIYQDYRETPFNDGVYKYEWSGLDKNNIWSSNQYRIDKASARSYEENLNLLKQQGLINTNVMDVGRAKLDYLNKQNQSYWFDDITKNVTGLVDTAAGVAMPFLRPLGKSLFDSNKSYARGYDDWY